MTCPHCGAEITYRRTITGKLKGVFMPANEYEDGITLISWQDKNFKADIDALREENNEKQLG